LVSAITTYFEGAIWPSDGLVFVTTASNFEGALNPAPGLRRHGPPRRWTGLVSGTVLSSQALGSAPKREAMKSESLVGRTCRSSPRLTSVDLGRRALQKRLNRSRCRLELGLGWTEGTTY